MGVLDNRCAQRVANGGSLGAALGASIGTADVCLAYSSLAIAVTAARQLQLAMLSEEA